MKIYERKDPAISKLGHMASQYQTIEVLLSHLHFKELQSVLAPCFLIHQSGVVPMDHWRYPFEVCTADYTSGATPIQAAFVEDEEELFAMDVGDGRLLVKSHRPLIHMQSFSAPIALDGEEAFKVDWGVQFLFPQIYQLKGTNEVFRSLSDPNFSMGQHYRTLTKWVRRNTEVVTLEKNDKTLRTTYRISPGMDLPKHLTEKGYKRKT